ncbi:hypothetical protein [Rhodothermus marinus]|uniref:hypothetical protein n=1 Tax=Rhodothermus marinus TaxID=29549 RepID=UPI0004A4BC55|nr:hypothetical protein [Rhodothermus marinus]
MMPDVETMRVIEEKWLDQLVEMARKTVENGKVYGKKCNKHGWYSEERCPQCGQRHKQILQRAQLSNLKNLADATDSVRVLELFIRYQMGRKEGAGWKYAPEGDERFGDMVIADLQRLEEWAQEINPSDPRAAHLGLIRLYTGFLIRWYVAFSGEDSGGETEE